ncbi:hypothetical protein SADUNF_Sadunf12G0111400 [Salix dunnii]|uniref:Uncharacterized protein n=1 Tax=Salix dunnii TaxID=1413687 RepID=A0A835JP70_9ROSI|nr:hypothetical protein SADUNF_Sadunf12G0111400 [Salix dunnii]
MTNTLYLPQSHSFHWIMRSLRNFPAYSSKFSPPFQEYALSDSFGRRQSLDSVSMQTKDRFASLLPVSLNVFHTPEIKDLFTTSFTFMGLFSFLVIQARILLKYDDHVYDITKIHDARKA